MWRQQKKVWEEEGNGENNWKPSVTFCILAVQLTCSDLLTGPLGIVYFHFKWQIKWEISENMICYDQQLLRASSRDMPVL